VTGEKQRGKAFRPYKRAYLAWHGLAWAGGMIAYQPFLSFLLPLKIVEIGGRPDSVLLSTAVLLGGVAAGLANLGWGMAADYLVARGGRRRALVLVGLAGTLISYTLLAHADSSRELLTALVCFQILLNLLLSALIATAADEVPDRDKGLLGGVLCAAAPAGAAASVVATLPGMSVNSGLLWTALLIPAFVLPYAFQPNYQCQRDLLQHASASALASEPHAFLAQWIVRLALQVASKTVFFFAVYYFSETIREVGPSTIAQVALLAALVAAPAGLLLGRLSDRNNNHRSMILLLIAGMVGGLVLMALQTNWLHAVAGYLLFACSAAICLALHAGYSMLQLPAGLGSGKGLGLLNLTNTLPAIAVAGLGAAIIPQHGYRTLCWILALIVTLAGGALMWPRIGARRRQGGTSAAKRLS